MSVVELDDGPVRDRIEWVLALINDGAGADEVPAVFAASFLATFKPEAIVSLIEQQLRPAAPFTIERIALQTAESAALVVRGANGLGLVMTISIEVDAPHLVLGVGFQPYGDAVKPESWEALDELLHATAPDTALLVAEVIDGDLRPVHALDADRVLPLGSAFKLYVLAALASEIEAGRCGWDDRVMITDERRVHSSLLFAPKPSGTEVSLRETATAMISVSDNTATDLVMYHVGRAAIEEHLARAGMRNPSITLPFLTTREVTRLKWLSSDADRDGYVAAGVDERRRLLEALPDASTVEGDLKDAVPTAPVAIREIEWFASPADLGRVHVALHDMGEEVRRILSVNAGQGIDFDRDRWPHLSFKGGSEPGVLAMSWLGARSDGRTFVVAAQLCNDDGQVSIDVVRSVAGAFDLLAAVE